MTSVGIVGFGSFGQFMALHLRDHFEVFVYDIQDRETEATALKVSFEPLKTVLRKEVVVLGIPVQYLEGFLQQEARNVNPESLILDVASVKVEPLALIEQYLPKNRVIGIHPLFGPQSGKNGIEGLNMVLCPTDDPSYECLKSFLSETLNLNVLERTPEEHDKQMGYVQALTHFIGRAVNEMDIPDVEQKTVAYEHLLDLKRTLGRDSWDLFVTIEKHNPYAREIRENFLKELSDLNTNPEL
jgi:prephenate dehydrogenase